jgi:hypothetical protein
VRSGEIGQRRVNRMGVNVDWAGMVQGTGGDEGTSVRTRGVRTRCSPAFSRRYARTSPAGDVLLSLKEDAFDSKDADREGDRVAVEVLSILVLWFDHNH